VLAIILERPGEVVTREELQKRLWPDGTFVDFDHSVNNAINKIREALGDSAESPRFVETLSRRGYRFIGPVEGIRKGSVLSQPQAPSPWSNHPCLKWLLPISAFARRTWPWPGAVLVVLAMVVGVWLFRGSPGKPQAVPEVVPLTSYSGKETFPSFSPDGNQVAFSWNGEKQENFDIYVKVIGFPDAQRRTTDAAKDLSPAFSPDGRSIGFVRVTKEHANFIVIPSIVGPERSVAEVPLPDANSGTLFAWLPDGKWVVTDGLELLSLETRETRKLTSPPTAEFTDSSPAVSPDGRTIAFCRSFGWFRWTIYLLDLTEDLKPKGEPRQLTTLRGCANAGFTWTPSGQEIVFVSRGSLWRIAASGKEEAKELPYGKGEAAWPTISRNGNRLAYEQELYDRNIWHLPLSPTIAAAGPSSQLLASTRVDQGPQYSPDGKRIVFVSCRTGTCGIWVSDEDGSNVVELFVKPGNFSGSPRWSPDGQRIAFDSILAGNMDIYVIPVAGAKLVRLTTDPADDNVPSWSRDGNWVYFTSLRSGRRQVWKTPAGGGEAVPVTQNGGFAALESLDGKFVYYTKGTPELSLPLWRVPVGGGEESQVLPSVRCRAFDLVTDGIYFIGEPSDDGKYSIQFMSFDTRQVSIVAPIRGPSTFGLSVSPDRRHLLYSQSDQSGGDLMLVENFR
jgi:Tol biopolymer transport system component